jgi:hypothetical protein
MFSAENGCQFALVWLCFQLLLLQMEACVLQAEVDTGPDTEAELESLKQQWHKQKQLLRMLATRNSVTDRKNIKQLRFKLSSYIMKNKRMAKIPSVILSFTREGKTYYKHYPFIHHEAYSSIVANLWASTACYRDSFTFLLTHLSYSY